MSIKSIYGFQAPPAQYQQSQGISVCDNQFFEVWNLVGDLDSISTEPAINIYTCMCTEETKIQFTFPLEIKIWWVTTSKLRYHTEAIWWGVKARENCQLDDLLEHLIGQSKVTCVWIYPLNRGKFCKKYLGIKKTHS